MTKFPAHIYLPVLIAICSSASCVSAGKVSTSAGNALIVAHDSLYPPESLKVEGHTPYTQKHYPERIVRFRREPLRQHDVVFLGNSITEMGGDWEKRLGKPGIRNRGIGGDISAGVLQRLGEIVFARPAAVFLLIGINDLMFTEITPEKLSENILEIASRLHRQSPKTKIFIQTILPTNRKDLASKISETNRLISAHQRPGKFILVDLHALFADGHDLMKKELTTDGVHLNEQGYAVWVEKIKPFFR
ncbi:GDSL-type esterase/lipase family protein [Chitinophaga sp. NPDC101104]|uniref:GDSL-type esterase/lipase family protein n=1 Tax=Chitinophaga sp. NPDC101104 TaxID=3390561 RepID=UPI003CFD4F8E